jgi:translation initiation factor IF-2
MVDTELGSITFIDTPGHAVFKNMRQRGAQCTDIIVLVVSAVEGVQSQTREILDILQESKLPFIVALNKIDLPKADPETVEDDLWDLGVELESRGGSVPIIHISAVEGTNTKLLLE